MRARRSINLLLALLLSFVFPNCARTQTALTAQTPAARVVIRAARMLDVSTGQEVKDGVVIVEGYKIVAAGAGLQVPQGAKVIDLGDATILPGLIDAHTH